MFSLQRRLFAGYGNKEHLPLGGYALLDLVYIAGLVGGLRWTKKRTGAHFPEKAPFSDMALIGMATHKLSVILTKEWSTAPLRAPFTKYQSIEKAGELNEVSRGHGFREAVGDLLTCPYCTGVWVATGFSLALANTPKATRFVASIFGAVAVADFLNCAYERV